MIKLKDYLFPVFLLLCVLVADKFFSLPWVVENTYPYKKIERSFYESKRELFTIWQDSFKAEPNFKYGVIFGSSRSGEFDSDLIEEIYPGTKTFNFSAPLAPPSFYYYWLKALLNSGNKISYVILEADPILFTKTAVKYSLDGSYDTGFIIDHTNWIGTQKGDPWKASSGGFSSEEAETYLLKRLFALYKNPVDVKNVIANNSELKAAFLDIVIPGFKGKDQKAKTVQAIQEANKKKLGAFPNDLHFTNQSFFLEVDSENIFNLYLKGFKYSPTQVYFFKETLRLLVSSKIPTVIYFPVSAEPLRKRYISSGLLESFKKDLNESVREISQDSILVIDPYETEKWTCRDFFDSVHLSGKCFSDILPILFNPVLSKK